MGHEWGKRGMWSTSGGTSGANGGTSGQMEQVGKAGRASGAQVGHKWGTRGAHVGHTWGTRGAQMGHTWGTNGAHVGHKWGRSGVSLASGRNRLPVTQAQRGKWPHYYATCRTCAQLCPLASLVPHLPHLCRTCPSCPSCLAYLNPWKRTFSCGTVFPHASFHAGKVSKQLGQVWQVAHKRGKRVVGKWQKAGAGLSGGKWGKWSN